MTDTQRNSQLANIEVDSIDVCLEPTTLMAIPGSDSAVVLCVGSQSVVLILASEDELQAHIEYLDSIDKASGDQCRWRSTGE